MLAPALGSAVPPPLTHDPRPTPLHASFSERVPPCAPDVNTYIPAIREIRAIPHFFLRVRDLRLGARPAAALLLPLGLQAVRPSKPRQRRVRLHPRREHVLHRNPRPLHVPHLLHDLGLRPPDHREQPPDPLDLHADPPVADADLV